MVEHSDKRHSTAESGDNTGRYEKYRADMYQKRMPIFWWVHKKAYVWFILRELTSISVAMYALIMIFQIRALLNGPDSYQALVDFFTTPFSIVLHAILLVAMVFHSFTWFNLAPTAMVLKLGKKRIPGAAIIAVNYGMWFILSITVAWFILTP